MAVCELRHCVGGSAYASLSVSVSLLQMLANVLGPCLAATVKVHVDSGQVHAPGKVQKEATALEAPLCVGRSLTNGT